MRLSDMYVSSMHCGNTDCSAQFEVYSATTNPGTVVCKFCGAELLDMSFVPLVGGDDGEPGGEDPELVVLSGPMNWGGMAPLSWDDPRLTGRITEAFEEGTPSLVTHGRARAVLIGAVEFARLVATAPLVVDAHRRHAAPSSWTLSLPELGVVATGFTYDEALTQFVTALRRRIRSVVADPFEAYGRRDLALQLWLADGEGRLHTVLADAVRLQNEHKKRQ